MKGRAVRIACCCIPIAGFIASASAQQTDMPRDAAPAYKLLRFEEDYRYLRDPRKRTDIWDPVKYVPLGIDPGWYVSFGGELRERFEYYTHPNLGLQGQGPNGYLLHRVLLHADLHASDYVRAFVQFGSHLAPWKDSAAPPYLDRLDLQQGFVDFRLPLFSNADLDPVLRVGRQEMVYGSQRLVAIRDAPNVRLNFDGVRLSGTFGGVRVDAFVTRPVLQRDGVFDDTQDTTRALWGLYTTTPLGFVPGGKLDVYYFGFENTQARFAAGTGEERRQTIGTRFFGIRAGWDWDWEALGQFGTFAAQDIQAWGVSTDTGYTFNAGDWKVRVGLKADTGSGDRNLNDGTLGTLNAMFPKLAYFNQAALLGPSNVVDLQPALSLMPTDKLKITVGYDFLWRATTADAIYTGTGAPITGTAGQPGRFTAGQLSVDLVWQLDRHILAELGYVHLDAAKVLKAAGGRDVDFAYAAATYRF